MIVLWKVRRIILFLNWLDMANIQYVTKEGLEKLRSELDYLESVERPNISKQIAEARDKGDLSENAEYDAAKEAQGMLEMKIAKLKETIAGSRIIDESKLDTSKVQIMNKVKIKNLKNNAVMTYTWFRKVKPTSKPVNCPFLPPLPKACWDIRWATKSTFRFLRASSPLKCSKYPCKLFFDKHTRGCSVEQPLVCILPRTKINSGKKFLSLVVLQDKHAKIWQASFQK